MDDVVESLRDLVCLKCEKSRIGDDESLISRVMGVRTGGMLRRREEYASIGKVFRQCRRRRYELSTEFSFNEKFGFLALMDIRMCIEIQIWIQPKFLNLRL